MNRLNINWSSFSALGKESEYLLDAFTSGWISSGSYVEKLESELEKVFLGSKCFTVSNGTSALQLAFQLLGIKPGDNVIVPGFCFQAAGNVLSQLGAVPVFCDVDSITWNQTKESIIRCVNDKTVGIVVVHNYGRAAPVEEIVNWAKDNDLWVIEDCAEAWFTKYKNRYVGQFGDVATFSMHATKTISSGEGGVVMLNNDLLTNKLKLLRSHGLDRNKKQYFHELAGNNYRLSNLLCAIAYAQLENRNLIEAKQKERAKWYYEHLSDHWCINFQSSVLNSDDNIWAIAVRINSNLVTITRDQLMQILLHEGIETRPGFYPASLFSYNQAYLVNDIHVSESIAKDILVLPCSSSLTKDEIYQICEVLKKNLDAYRQRFSSYRFIDLRACQNYGEKLQLLLSTLGSGVELFRYFNHRNFDVVHQHDISLLLELNDKPIGYGHIETVEGVSWLGIAMSEAYTGNGWGKLVISQLITSAMSLSIKELNLRVDRINLRAINLYLKNGFVEVPSKSNKMTLHMIRQVVASF